MEYSMRLTVAIFAILCFISTAFGECGVKDLRVGAVMSGRKIGGKAEWNVQVINICNCSQSNIVLRCPDFQTTEPVDPSLFKKIGDLCTVNGGRPIQPQAYITFSYAWDRPFTLLPFSTKSSC